MRIEDLTTADLERCPIWEFSNNGEEGETAVRSVKGIPAKTLAGRVVGVRVRLANGEHVWALVGNVDASNSRLTRHFVTLSFLNGERWFTLARYHDFDRDEHGPQVLAAFLGLNVEDVFPIYYDIRRFCIGDPGALEGTIEKEPREVLTRAEIIALAVP